MTGHLYAVATPIGNLDDISKRAIDTLAKVDVIAAEDTRRSINLLRHLGLDTPLVSYHEHSSSFRHEEILGLLKSGKRVALISDAGTPGIADPGEELIHDWIALGGEVTVIPGASALIPGLILSGLPGNRFVFEGFLPRAGRIRRQVLKTLNYEHRTMVFYEAPHRLSDTLTDMAGIFGGDRKAAVVREITKVHEEALRGSLSCLQALAQSREIKGEIVLVVEGSSSTSDDTTNEIEPQELILELLGEGLSPAQAAKRAAALTKLPREQLYKLAVLCRRQME